MQDSLECAGPQKHNGESLVSIHCMVIEIQPLFWTSSTNYDASTKHDAILDRISKNSFISRIIYRSLAKKGPSIHYPPTPIFCLNSCKGL